jgi:LysM repeat protein
MDRRQLLFIVLLNTLISFVVAIVVVWLAEMRRPDLEALAARYTPPPPVVLIATPTLATTDNTPSVVAPTVQQSEIQTTATPATAVTASTEPEIYVVQEGDSLYVIALRYNLTVDQLMEANELTNPDFVFSGQRLIIPVDGQTGATDTSEQTTNPGSGLTLQVEQPNNLAEERVLIVNDGNSAVNLQGWTLGSVNGPVYAFGDLPLFPGGSVSVHSESGQDDSLNLYWSQTSPVWSSGTVARLFNQEGREVTSYTVP